MHDYEIENDIRKVNAPLMNFINYFILNEHYTTSRLLFKIIHKIRKLEKLREKILLFFV